jgi:hypothetical protein
MGKSRPSAPPVPDPNQLIQQDAAANRITQFTPYGNLLFGSVGDQGQFVQGAVPEGGTAAAFTQETPFQSNLRLAQETLGLGLAREAGEQFDALAAQTPFNFTANLPAFQFQDATNLPAFQSQLPGAGTGPTSLNVPDNLPTLPTDFEDTRRQVTQSVFDRQLGLLQPEFTRQREALEQNLADRGLPIGGEAYNSAIDRLERQQGEQQQRLAQQADVAGGQEASRLFGQASTARGQLFREAAAQGEFGLAGQQQAFGQQAANVAQQNAARQQQIADQLRANELNNMARQAQLSERVGLRGQQFNELASLLGGPQIQRPTFFTPSAINTLGANTLAQSAAANAFNQGMANYSSGLGGLFDLAGSLGSAYILR